MIYSAKLSLHEVLVGHLVAQLKNYWHDKYSMPVVHRTSSLHGQS